MVHFAKGCQDFNFLPTNRFSVFNHQKLFTFSRGADFATEFLSGCPALRGWFGLGSEPTLEGEGETSESKPPGAKPPTNFVGR